MEDHQVNLASSQPHLSPGVTRIRFPGLNTVRFYAALSVIVEHVGSQVTSDHSVYNIINLFFINAQHSVNLFFVLSGFLITYILLVEREKAGVIHIRNFYLKRILRIWPLYYWVALLGLVVFPLFFGKTYPLTGLPSYKLILAFTLLPNFASITAPMIHLWSIGVEEQFYLSWPWASKSDTAMLRVCFGIIIIKLSLTPILISFHDEKIMNLFNGLRFECMAIGALGAYLYFRDHRYLKWIYHPWIQISAIAAFVYLVIFELPINTYNIIWSSLTYIVLILNVATNQQSLLRLNYYLTEKFGEISYGLYLYHFPVLYLIFFAAYETGVEIIWTSPLLLLIFTLASTWVIAFLSYRWFETPFLNLKKHLTVTSPVIKQSM